MTNEQEVRSGGMSKLAILAAILAAFTIADISRMGPPPSGEVQVEQGHALGR